MIQVRLPDGSTFQVQAGIAVRELLERIDEPLEGLPIGARVNGRQVDLECRISTDSILEIITDKDRAAVSILRHSSAHLMAAAVKHIYGEVKFGVGPAIEDGFYYDFDLSERLSEEAFPRIEQEMRRIADSGERFERMEMPREEAISLMQKAGQPYKVELLQDITEERVSLYRLGDFVDLCRGPHLPNAGLIRVFRLLSVAGSYWRGDERRPMLQRIYGTAFFTEEALEEYLRLLEEAKKRDHRKLGQQLDLFSFHEEGPGFPFFHPKGMIIYNTLVDYWRRKHFQAGYGEVRTPIILNEELWRRSGHWDNYRENMYFTQIDGDTYAVKPMNCPGGLLIYKSSPKSYRDLPLRIAELGLVHRHEKKGVLHGLQRVRQFTQDDAHIFCTPEQLEGEVVGVIRLLEEIYRDVGFENYTVELSTKPWKHIGSDEEWNAATEALKRALKTSGLEYEISEGEGAFYGPKIDFHIADSLHRTWQCGTIQVDFSMPKRFNLEYIGRDNRPHTPVMIHRAIYGALERFIANLIEHYGGAFPLWLAPEQVRVIPVSERHLAYAQKVFARLRGSFIRAEIDEGSEKVGYKIRKATLAKVPYMLIIGAREEAEASVSVRKREEGDLGPQPLEDFCRMVEKEAFKFSG